MSLIFSIIGFVVLGFIVRAFFQNSSVKDKPRDSVDWIVQIVISAFIGFIVWTAIPEKCKHSNESDYNGRYYE